MPLKNASLPHGAVTAVNVASRRAPLRCGPSGDRAALCGGAGSVGTKGVSKHAPLARFDTPAGRRTKGDNLCFPSSNRLSCPLYGYPFNVHATRPEIVLLTICLLFPCFAYY